MLLFRETRKTARRIGPSPHDEKPAFPLFGVRVALGLGAAANGVSGSCLAYTGQIREALNNRRAAMSIVYPPILFKRIGG